jgi:protein-disulfide isomerase
MKNLAFLTSLLGLLFFSVSTWAAPTDKDIEEIKAEINSLKEGQQATQKSLEEIKKLLEQGARPAARRAPAFEEQVVDVSGSPFMGENDAPLTLVEFSDYECPFCARHYHNVMPLLKEEYIASGKLKFVMKENPLTSLHRNAFNASLAALCAEDQGEYWSMHNVMFENMKRLTANDLKQHAADIGLDTAAFNECLDSRKYEKAVNDDLAMASKLGVRGTPGFLLGVTDAEDSDKALMKVYIKGAQSIQNFRAQIDRMLDEAE